MDQKINSENVNLFQAIVDANPSAIRPILYKGAEVNAIDDTGYTPLMAATMTFCSALEASRHNGRFGKTARNLMSIMDILLEHGAKADVIAPNGHTALTMICSYPQFNNELMNGLRVLFKYGANINQPNKIGKTPIFYAQDQRIINILMEKGIDLVLQDNRGQTPLMQAVLSANAYKVEVLCKAGNDLEVRDAWGNNLLVMAIELQQNQALSMVKYDHKIRKVIIETLLEAGVNPNEKGIHGMTPIMHTGNKDIIGSLLKYGADVNMTDDYGCPAFIRIVKERTLVNSETNSTNINSLRSIFSMVEDIDAPDSNGFTALMHAAMKGEDIMVRLLIREYDANVNAVNNKGSTALIWAVANRCYDAAEILIKHGADVNIANDKGMTPLMYASVNHDFGTVQLLLSYGANIGAVDNQTENAHALALQNPFGLIAVPNFLLENGGVLEEKVLSGNVVHSFEEE